MLTPFFGSKEICMQFYLLSLTIFWTVATVPSGEPASAARTLPDLSTTKTPRTAVVMGDLRRPMAPMSVCSGSQSSGYGSFWLVWKRVLASGLSLDRP